MNNTNSLKILGLFAVSCLMAGPVAAQDNGDAVSSDDRTLSPYFFVKSEDPTIDQLPLKANLVDVEIAGVIAKVRVHQIYENAGERPIEAIYVFPGSTRAAVYAMQMTLDDRTVEARIEERETARQQYEDAIDQGQTASLLEQQRPNVFQMNVGNLMPGDTIDIELNYVELLVPEDGEYEFVFPTVVGPRYSETPADGASGSDQWVENPYLHQDLVEPYEYDINLALNSGIPISSAASPSHDVQISYTSLQEVSVSLNERSGAGTKDYVFRYNLQGDTVESGVLLYAGEDENFFLVMVEPPARVTSEMILPREYLFILDVSGSMRGFPLDTSKQMMRALLEQLNPDDSFNILAFASGHRVLFESPVDAVSENIDFAIQQVDGLSGGGGTRLLNTLDAAFALPRREESLSRTTVVLTDGFVNVEAAAFDLIREKLNLSNLFAMGIGSSSNRYLIEGMATAGLGEPLFITQPSEVDRSIQRFSNYIKEPVLSRIQVEFDGFDAYEIEPPAVPDVFAQRPVIVFGKYRGEPSGQITLSGFTGNGTFEKSLPLSSALEKDSNEALRYLWARHRIKTLSDYSGLHETDDLVAEITRLGLTYSLLTKYTSFIAVLTEIRNEDGAPTPVTQPLPLPEGVSDSAVAVEDWQLHGVSGEIYETDGPAQTAGDCQILEVLSGDTVRVLYSGSEECVKLLGVSAPGPGEVGYYEARQSLAELLQEKTISLQFESLIIGRRDADGSLLAYVLADGKNVNLEQIVRGWARATGPSELKYAEDFQRAETEAESACRGIWISHAP